MKKRIPAYSSRISTGPFFPPTAVHPKLDLGNREGHAGQENRPESAERIQKKERPGAPLSPPSGGTPPPPTPTPEATPLSIPAATSEPVEGRFIVSDSATPQAGQMRQSTFLDQLNAEVCAATDEALAGTPFSSDACPYIRRAFERHRHSSPAQLEAVLHRYDARTRQASRAADLIAIIRTRTREAVTHWKNTGDLSMAPPEIAAEIPASAGMMGGAGGFLGGLMSGIPAIGSGILSGIGSLVSGIGSLFFKSREGSVPPAHSPAAVRDSLGNGQSMDGSTRRRMEGAFGSDFGDVKIHTDAHAGKVSEGLNARAFTVGKHVAFGRGEYHPGNPVGDALLAHELAHVEQQRGIVDYTQTKSTGQEEQHLEEEADTRAIGGISRIHPMGQNILGPSGSPSKSGLKIQRCSKGKQQQPGPSTTELTAGGISGITLDATFTVSNTPCQTLQIIQVVWATQRSEARVGKMTITEGSKTYDAFVDGGKNSPFVLLQSNPPAHPSKPYYLTADEHSNQVHFNNNNGTIRVYDRPGAVASWEETNFETAVVCVNHNNSGKDKILKVFKWGWTGKGTSPTHGQGQMLGGQPTGITLTSSVSSRFKQIVAHDYPSYTFD